MFTLLVNPPWGPPIALKGQPVLLTITYRVSHDLAPAYLSDLIYYSFAHLLSLRALAFLMLLESARLTPILGLLHLLLLLWDIQLHHQPLLVVQVSVQTSSF